MGESDKNCFSFRSRFLTKSENCAYSVSCVPMDVYCFLEGFQADISTNGSE